MSITKLLALSVIFLFVGTAHAATIDVGVFSFDLLLPGSDTPGVNSFAITNLTGDPSGGGSAVPPAFAVYTSISFANSAVTLVTPSGGQVVPLGSLGPGANNPVVLQFPESQQFLAATFSFDLDATQFVTDDGTLYQVSAQNWSIPVLPSSGSVLQAGIDFALIRVDAEPVLTVVVPEPGFVCCPTGVLGLLLYRRRLTKSKK